MRIGIGAVELAVLRLDRERASTGHRIPGVDREVQDHLGELAAVDEDGRELRLEPALDQDVFAEEPLEQGQRFDDDGVHVADFGRQHLLPAEGEQLPGELCRLLRQLDRSGRSPGVASRRWSLGARMAL